MEIVAKIIEFNCFGDLPNNTQNSQNIPKLKINY